MKVYAIATTVAIVALLGFAILTSNAEKIEPAFDGNETSLIDELNEDDGLNLEEYPTFKGKVKELNDGSAILIIGKDEDDFQEGDLVVIELPEGYQLEVGEEVTVEYDGRIMESYPLQVNVMSVNGVQMDEAVQTNESTAPDEGISNDK